MDQRRPDQQGAPPAPPRSTLQAVLRWLLPTIALGGVIVLIVLTANPPEQARPVTLSYSQLVKDAQAHQIKTITLGPGGSASGAMTDGTQYMTVIPSQAGSSFLDALQAEGVGIQASSSGGGTDWGGLLGWGLMLVPLGLLMWWSARAMRRAGGPVGGIGALGKARARVIDAERPATTFGDVAGYEGAKSEIAEVVDFLRHPERYRQAGAVAPKGVLMVGPPGTGKTLLARAVAGEAAVPFFSVVGSSFVEMFVGVGASRVRDLFAEARKRAPAIVFVDEIDAIGAHRSVSGIGVSNDEREQTLNQLLSELDGFDPAEGVVVLAATNRPEILDPALLRPGRFDRQVVVPLPTQSERRAILEVHCREKHLDPGVDLDAVARATPGFSGADLANLANEAAINSVRDQRPSISRGDFAQARDRILIGRRDGSNVLLPDEKHAVAVHEAGHALVAALSEHADPVEKVTILPAGQALGVTEQLPLVERHLFGEDYLRDSLAVRLGGRAAELLELGQGSTGAANDLTQATDLALRMVREFGLSPEVGPVSYPVAGSVFLGRGGGELASRPYAEATQALIDREVARLVREAEQRATALLKSHRRQLQQLVGMLLEQETVDGSAVQGLVERAGAARPRLLSAASDARGRTRRTGPA